MLMQQKQKGGKAAGGLGEQGAAGRTDLRQEHAEVLPELD